MNEIPYMEGIMHEKRKLLEDVEQSLGSVAVPGFSSDSALEHGDIAVVVTHSSVNETPSAVEHGDIAVW
jgi:hypothetical protein